MLVRSTGAIQCKLCQGLRCPILACRAHSGSPSVIAIDTSSRSMEKDVEQLVRKIHSSRTKAAIIVTGGASQGVSWLLSVPGASATVAEVVVPYSRNSLLQTLGQEPAQFCSPDTALSLAKAAYQRAAALTSFGTPVIGLAATCALASEPPKRGDHRAYVAAHNSSGSRLLSIKLVKGSRTRWQEEQLVGRLLLKVLAESCDVDSSSLQLPLILQPAAATQQAPAADTATAAVMAGAHDELQTQTLPPPEPLQDLIDGKIRCVEYSGGEVFVDAPRSAGKVYLPGSFNPLHEGHKAMMQAALERAVGSSSGGEVEGCFELAAVNADKGHLEVEEIQRRVAQFIGLGLPVLVTAAPLLVGKARLLPGAVFVLGWDTAVRIVMPKYYGDSETSLQLTFGDIRHHGCSFLVAGRVDEKGDKNFKTLRDIRIPAEMADLFEEIPEGDFRSDISSTALRSKGMGLAKE